MEQSENQELVKQLTKEQERELEQKLIAENKKLEEFLARRKDTIESSEESYDDPDEDTEDISINDVEQAEELSEVCSEELSYEDEDGGESENENKKSKDDNEKSENTNDPSKNHDSTDEKGEEDDENGNEEENESEEIVAADNFTNYMPDTVENKVEKRKSLSDNIEDIPEDSPPTKIGRIDPVLEDAGKVFENCQSSTFFENHEETKSNDENINSPTIGDRLAFQSDNVFSKNLDRPDCDEEIINSTGTFPSPFYNYPENQGKEPLASYDMFQQHPTKSPGFMDFMMDDIDDASQEDDFTTEYEEIQDVPDLENENACTRIAEQLEFIADGEPDDNIPISYQNALVFNETYQNHLHSVLDMLQEALQNNRNRQEEIESDLVELEQGRTIDYHKKQEIDQKQEGSSSLLPSNPLASTTRKAAVSIFAAPYFKDCNLFTHPDNIDTIRQKCNNELDVYLTTPKEWRKSEKDKLFRAVKEDALKKRMRGTNQEKETILIRLNSRYTDETERKELVNKLNEIKSKESVIREQSDIELFNDSSEEFSWLEISMQTFDGFFSERSCRLMWRNVLHPSINKSHWTKKEDQLLKQLAGKQLSENQGFANWDHIASNIGKGRTSFNCFMRYQQKHNSFLDNRKWTYEEDKRLKQLVSQCRINKHFVPWPKVSYYMSNRTKDQCYQRYVYSLQSHLRKGIFKENEDFVIIIGVKLFGHNWAKISDFLPNRTPIQIHSRFNTFLNANFQSWTREEDVKLLQLVKEKGYRVWAEIAKSFDNRTRSQCRNRFYIIYKMFELAPNSFDLKNVKYRSQDEVTLQGRRQTVLYDNLDKKINLFIESRKLRTSDKKMKKKNLKSRTNEKVTSKRRQNELSNDERQRKDSVEFQISDDCESDFNSEDEFDLDVEKQGLANVDQTKDVIVQSQSNIYDRCPKIISKEETAKSKEVSALYHVTPEGTKIPRRYLLEFLRSLQSDLPSKGSTVDEGGYGKVEYQRNSNSSKSSLSKRYENLMPIKHMSAFVSTNKKGIPITTFKGNTGRHGAVQNTSCKQALTDRSLSIYFRPSWPGRVGKPMEYYKMAKSHQDQLRQVLTAANFYGQLLQIYPIDLKHKIDMINQSSLVGQSQICADEILELFMSEENKTMFCYQSSTQLTNSDGHADRVTSSSDNHSCKPSLKTLSHKTAPDINPESSNCNMTRQPPIRTYSRKRNLPGINAITNQNKDQERMTHKVYKAEKKTNCNTRNTQKLIHFIPSNNQTLVGFRGLLLQLRTFKSLVYPDGTGVRISLDRIAQEGIHHIDLFSDQKETTESSHKKNSSATASPLRQNNDSGNGENQLNSDKRETETWDQKQLTWKKADKLLIDRFLSLYFWPSQMSAARPPPRESIFEPSTSIDAPYEYTRKQGELVDSFNSHPIGPSYTGKYGGVGVRKESVAAAQPFDASKIIEAAKIRAATTPQRRIIIVPRKSNHAARIAVPKLEPGADSHQTANSFGDSDQFDNSLSSMKRDSSADSISSQNEEVRSPEFGSSSSDFQATTSSMYQNEVAPPPLKKRMLLKSLEQSKQSEFNERVESNVSVVSASTETGIAKKPLRTYSRRRKI